MNLIGSFPKLTEDERAWLLSVAETIQYKTNDVIIHECETIDRFLIIKSGNLRITRTYLDDISAEFAGPLGPGEVIGEMSFMDHKGASANLIADGPTEIIAITRDALFGKLDSDTSFAARFYECLFLELSRKLRSTNQRVLPVPP
jgi:CRP/FNR family transcriptional regulator, cyclic AMP receptor protein